MNLFPAEYQGFHSVLSLLSYLCKAPLVPPGAPVVNALFNQRSCIVNVLRACIGLPPHNHMGLEHKMSQPGIWAKQKGKEEPMKEMTNGHVVNGN